MHGTDDDVIPYLSLKPYPKRCRAVFTKKRF